MASRGNYIEMVKFLSFPNITFEIGTLSCLVILEPCNSRKFLRELDTTLKVLFDGYKKMYSHDQFD
jgi:hypothetical protein